ncbi:hypothetical protein FHW69_001178 [Luteibacter sp. Sphag1AF]|uniref:hypothetical protein n=1 Tax=Luteibacter sp. Sphag1AF TaxID=2587031 RepID=UPI001618FD18|nr:hypothetical protein [Luteibacter sp. Sphag1AF]MBB3226588.1 hypothetical protein [Luteibacter sp. Sphag1AF]
MNRFLDRLAKAYAPLGQRGLLFDGQYQFAAKEPAPEAPALAPADKRVARLRSSTARTLRLYAHRPRGAAR